MSDHLSNRDRLVESLREELVGPSPSGRPIELVEGVEVEEVGDLYGAWYQARSGEEILTRDRPTKRYGVGILYPIGVRGEDGGEGMAQSPDDEEGAIGAPGIEGEVLGDKAEKGIEEAKGRRGRADMDQDLDFEIQGVNEYKPSAMALTFMAGDLPSQFDVEVTGGFYRPWTVRLGDRRWRWWWRTKTARHFEIEPASLQDDGITEVRPLAGAEDALDLRIQVVCRTLDSGRLITVCLINRTSGAFSVDEKCLFQTRMSIRCLDATGSSVVQPYPEPQWQRDEEEMGLSLLFRDRTMFAMGHGCAANWDSEGGKPPTALSTEVLPSVDVPNVTPEIRREDGTLVSVPMAALAGLEGQNDGLENLAEVVHEYRSWIEERRQEAEGLDPKLQATAAANIDRCLLAARRMEAGLERLREDPEVARAFRLANLAMLVQQLRSRRSARQASWDGERGVYRFIEAARDPSDLTREEGQGEWRPFQVAFQLMCLSSVADGTDDDRDRVELIWFPTGGGKTEAYLGLAAFSMLLRRIRNPEDRGVDVLMRYTLRLLTAQQFQRAARLICALEWVRRRPDAELGDTPFSIGMWLGSGTTPNVGSEAKRELRWLTGARRGRGRDWLVVRACPWCGAEMGVVRRRSRKDWPDAAPRVLGYEEFGDEVVIRCPDQSCEFADKLPLMLVDEWIYREPPTMLIGTVDKFASLTWREPVRALFGLGEDGSRVGSPPSLILQDELHLISGPLGSMVGLYESVVDELCTTESDGQRIRPKVVCATATIRGFQRQVRALFARDEASVFPPPGLSISDSFFSSEALTRDGKPIPGKKYLGVHAPALGSVPTAQVRTFSAVLQGTQPFDREERDPWWTLMVFYNSLRELGTGLSLLQTDIPEHLRSIANRSGLTYRDLRRVLEVQELTGRLRDEEIPLAIEYLERTTVDHRYPVDVCLASNIIEVGVDIDRLSLLAVVGQPKTVSQYIQVTGRVGRRWKERPGLVVTVYNPAKPRDRSHYEHFRSFHERLYAQVEPTSVTPFSRPALLRALHAVMVAYVRQRGPTSESSSPYPVPKELLTKFRSILRSRGEIASSDDVPTLEEIFDHRMREWSVGGRSRWEAPIDAGEIPLMYSAGAYVPDSWRHFSWPTPWSMRTVDAECQAVITQLYNQVEAADED